MYIDNMYKLIDCDLNMRMFLNRKKNIFVYLWNLKHFFIKSIAEYLKKILISK